MIVPKPKIANIIKDYENWRGDALPLFNSEQPYLLGYLLREEIKYYTQTNKSKQNTITLYVGNMLRSRSEPMYMIKYPSVISLVKAHWNTYE